jgi:hypothetical protein
MGPRDVSVGNHVRWRDSDGGHDESGRRAREEYDEKRWGQNEGELRKAGK